MVALQCIGQIYIPLPHDGDDVSDDDGDDDVDDDDDNE